MSHAGKVSNKKVPQCKQRPLLLSCQINGSSQNFSHSFHIHLEEQSNYLSLIPPHLIPEFFENGQNTMYIQQ